MEPARRWRHSCRPPVSAFLRDPSSGRVYRRGKLIGKVRTPAPRVRERVSGRAGLPAGRGGVCAPSLERERAGVRPGLTSACAACRREFGVWGRLAGLAPGSVLYRSHGAAAEAGLWRLVLWPWVVRPGVWTCTRVLQVSSFL